MEPAGKDSGAMRSQFGSRDSLTICNREERSSLKICPEEVQKKIVGSTESFSSLKLRKITLDWDLNKIDVFGNPNLNVGDWSATLHFGTLDDFRRIDGLPIPPKHYVHAAMECNFEKLRAMLDAQFPHDKDNTFAAGRGGNLDILQFLTHQGFSLNEDTCAGASINGKLEALKWLRQNGCPWDERVCNYAAKQGHIELLQWAIKNEAPLNQAEVFQYAKGNFPVMHWLEQNIPIIKI